MGHKESITLTFEEIQDDDSLESIMKMICKSHYGWLINAMDEFNTHCDTNIWKEIATEGGLTDFFEPSIMVTLCMELTLRFTPNGVDFTMEI